MLPSSRLLTVTDGQPTVNSWTRRRALQTIYTQCRKHPAPKGVSLATFVLDVERFMMADATCGLYSYEDKASEIASNLAFNGEYLLKTYARPEGASMPTDSGASLLLVADSAALGKGTPAEAERAEIEKRERREEAIMAIDDEEDSVMQCGKCKSRKIGLEQKQTRGADEAMTVYYTCKTCGHRWKQ